MKLFPKKVSLAVWSLVLAIFTLVAFHGPFFRRVLQNVEGGWNGAVIFGTALLLLLVLDFLLYYALAWFGRGFGKAIIAFTLFGDAVMLYFVMTYDVLVTDEMMGNVLRTQYSEASGFFSFSGVLYILLLCVLPCFYVFGRKVEYGSFKRFLGWLGGCVAALLVLVFGNMKNWPWIDRNSTELGSLLMPWSYIVNTFRYQAAEKRKNVEEIPLPDATLTDDSPAVCILIIGESARRDHFSLYGYEKETNPYTSKDSVKAYVADAAATYTAAGVKAILEPYEADELVEILPNYLYRTGIDVFWRTSNWGEPPVHVRSYETIGDLRKRLPDADQRYDGALLEGLKEEILAGGKDQVFGVLHTYTNHGPTYNTNYPSEFEVFHPVSRTTEMSKVSQEELFNAYDNSIVYTDWMIHSVIETLRGLGRRSCVLFVSDHGESLGENNLYMHGVPYSMAPREQLEIPFVVWTSDPSLQLKDIPKVGQYHVFHTVLSFFKVDSPIFDENMSIFTNSENSIE